MQVKKQQLELDMEQQTGSKLGKEYIKAVCCHSAYLRLLLFLPAILIPACASSSPAYHMMYSAYKLNKQGNNIQPWCTPFPNLEPLHCSMFGANCCFLTHIQVSQKTVKVVWYSQLFKHFPQFAVIHTVNGEGNGNPLQYSCLENSMDRGTWWAIVHGVAKSQTRLSDFHFTSGK